MTETTKTSAALQMTPGAANAFDALPAPVFEPSAAILRLDSGFESAASDGGAAFSISLGGFSFGGGGGSGGGTGGGAGGPSGGGEGGGGGPGPAP